jgi:hypothetical protein
MGFGEESEMPAQQEEPSVPDTQQYDGDVYAYRQSSNSSLQAREAIYGFALPAVNDFKSFERVYPAILQRLSRIPAIGEKEYSEIVRDAEDIIDRADSDCRRGITETQIKKFYLRISTLVSRADVPVTGMSGVTAIISNNSNSKQEIRMPQQQAPPSSMFDGVGRLLGRGKQ